MYAPLPKLKCYCDLDLWPRNPNRIHLLVMTNHHSKLENPWVMNSLVIDLTDQQTYGLTCAKQYTPTSLKGGIIKKDCIKLFEIIGTVENKNKCTFEKYVMLNIKQNYYIMIGSIDVIRNSVNVGFFPANPGVQTNFYHYIFTVHHQT